MPRDVLLTVQYDGTGFAGWQRQQGLRTVQGVLEEALVQMVHHPVITRATSRTDAGVHARAMPVHFSNDRSIPCRGFVRGLATVLPADVGVTGAREVEAGFDPRDAAVAKTYTYRVYLGSGRQPLLDRQAWHAPAQALDLQAMRAAGAHLLGEHDFSAFRAAHCVSRTTLRTLYGVEVTEEPKSDVLSITVTGNAFLQHMVRIVAGTLVEVGQGKRPADAIPEILASRDRRRAGRTAPAHGLTLEAVHFEGYPRLGKRAGAPA